ncbi:MAG: electron transfer flavoprotein subunit beta/FixA family protein [Bdellovibrionota bacterium]|nr:electron transfer flavoprotein subunit beta/FixA family protein [Bdellovibrionota bacterium]
MKILVCVKQVPDTTAKLVTKADGSGIEERGFKWVMNPYDEFAVEEALQIKKENAAANITVVTLGPKARVVDTLRTALAMGCDEAALIDAPAEADSYLTANALSKFIEKEGGYDLILTGKQAIDASQSCVTQMLAENQGLAHANIVSKLDLGAEKSIVERDLSGGAKEVSEIPAKSVVGANKGLNTPRYASLPGIMKAKKKPVNEVSLSDLGLSDSDSKTKLSAYRMPAERPPIKFLDGEAAAQTSELVKLLREEAKVI